MVETYHIYYHSGFSHEGGGYHVAIEDTNGNNRLDEEDAVINMNGGQQADSDTITIIANSIGLDNLDNAPLSEVEKLSYLLADISAKGIFFKDIEGQILDAQWSASIIDGANDGMASARLRALLQEIQRQCTSQIKHTMQRWEPEPSVDHMIERVVYVNRLSLYSGLPKLAGDELKEIVVNTFKDEIRTAYLSAYSNANLGLEGYAHDIIKSLDNLYRRWDESGRHILGVDVDIQGLRKEGTEEAIVNCAVKVKEYYSNKSAPIKPMRDACNQVALSDIAEHRL